MPNFAPASVLLHCQVSEAMNQRTVRLLNAYARLTGQTVRQVRRWWYSLNWHERTRERQRLERELQRAERSSKSA